MKKKIKTEIAIQAPPELVWVALNDSDKYPHWNPLITSIRGVIEVGNKITVTMGKKNRAFKPVVIKKIKNEELTLNGKLLLGILYDAEHKFQLLRYDDATLFIQSVKFKGILTRRVNIREIEVGFNAMNKALKDLVEIDKETKKDY